MKPLYSSALIALTLLVFPFCNKDKDNGFQDYLRFTLDGSPVECRIQFYADYFPATLPGRINFGGSWEGGNINLAIEDEPNTIVAKAYPFEIGKTRTVNLFIRTGNSVVRYGAGSSSGYPAIDGTGQITITTLTSDYVQGTFACTTGPVNNIVKIVTGGTYKIRF